MQKNSFLNTGKIDTSYRSGYKIRNMQTVKAGSVNEYIALFPKEIQKILKEIRTAIIKAAPDTEEKISYGLPAYHLHGKPLVYFGGFEKHIGFYATPTGHEAFAKELSAYKQGKGSVQFPIEKPIPWNLITKIVKFRAKENLQKVKLKDQKKAKR